MDGPDLPTALAEPAPRPLPRVLQAPAAALPRRESGRTQKKPTMAVRMDEFLDSGGVDRLRRKEILQQEESSARCFVILVPAPRPLSGVVALAAGAHDDEAGIALLDQAAERCGTRLEKVLVGQGKGFVPRPKRRRVEQAEHDGTEARLAALAAPRKVAPPADEPGPCGGRHGPPAHHDRLH